MLSLVLGGVVLLLTWFSVTNRKPTNLPPGVWGWPIIGSLPSPSATMGDQVKELRKKYGDIITWKIGSRIFVYLCNFKLIKTAFNKQETASRPDFYSIGSSRQFGIGGIANNDGRVWHNNRRFTLRHLKDLGMGKTYLGDAIENEAALLVEDFQKQVGRPGPLPWSINVAVLNVIWQMVAGKRFDVNDEMIIKFSQMMLEAVEGFEGPVMWLDLFPTLISCIPFKIKTWLGMNTTYYNTKRLKDYMMEEVVKEHIKNYDPNDRRDFIDDYLFEMESQKDDPESTMCFEDLGNDLMELFTAGSLSTTTAIRWTILYLAKYPEVQKKAQEEIDSVVPKNEMPSLQHRASLPYFDAMMYEVQRLVSLAPMGFPHYTNDDMELDGYRIPKNTVLIGHQECCHTDPAYWEKPNEFYPEHFLDENGKLYIRKEGFLPFSVGRRSCVGEALARMELYFFLAALVQRFNFAAPEGEELSTEKNPSERLMAIPYPFNIVITSRE